MGLLGGTIHLESKLHMGTVVTVRLPVDARGQVQPGMIAPLVTSMLRTIMTTELGDSSKSIRQRVLKRA